MAERPVADQCLHDQRLTTMQTAALAGRAPHTVESWQGWRYDPQPHYEVRRIHYLISEVLRWLEPHRDADA